jgi:hypothetical protein
MDRTCPQIDLDVQSLAQAVVTGRTRTPALKAKSSTGRLLARHLAARRKQLQQAVYQSVILPHLAEFFSTTAKWRCIDGGNRSSKTYSCLLECARAFLGVDPHDKYPPRDGNALIVGKEEDDIARIWEGFTTPQFKMIFDERTQEKRAVRPDPENPLQLDPYDLANADRWVDSPPLIDVAKHLAGEPAWEDKKKGVPRVVRFKTGWKCLFRSSNGKPPQGDIYNLVWFDEQLLNEMFYDEAHRGLVGKIGQNPRWSPKGIWSATAQVTNFQLDNLRLQAEAGAEFVRAFFTTIESNPFFSDEEKRLWYEGMTHEEREVRYYGISRIKAKRIYGAYEPNGVHGCEPHVVPHDACRYIIVDPGLDHCGTLFIYIDKDEKHATIYDGFDLLKAGAGEWAAEVAKRQTDMKFEAAIIDQRRGRSSLSEKDDSLAGQYFTALTSAGVEVRRRGSCGGFLPGTDDTAYREQAVLNWLYIRGDGPFAGTPILQVMHGCCPELDAQIRNAHTDPKKPNKRARNMIEDVLVCLEYAAGSGLQYFTPEPRVPDREEIPSVREQFEKKKTRMRDRERRRRMLARKM